MLLKKILTILAITLLFGQMAFANKQSLENAKKTLNKSMGNTLEKHNPKGAMKLGIKGILHKKKHTMLSQEIEDSLEEYFIGEMGFNVFNRSALIIAVAKQEINDQNFDFDFDSTTAKEIGRFTPIDVLISGTLEKIGDYIRIKIVAINIETLKSIAIKSVNIGFFDNQPRLVESDAHALRRMAGTSPPDMQTDDNSNKLKASDAHAQRSTADLTPKCKTPTTVGDSACWLKVSNHENCYVWDTHPHLKGKFTWTGQCKAGIVDGGGTDQWTHSDGGQSGTGTYVNGKRNGEWEIRKANGDVHRGPYVNGKRNGEWEIREANGDVYRGPYVDGNWNGEWEIRKANGDVYRGPYVNDKKHGEWEEWFADGTVYRGPYVDGNWNGEWEIRNASGNTWIYTYRNGIKQ